MMITEESHYFSGGSMSIEIASMERLTIAERMASGRDQYIAKCRAENIKIGRPDTYRKSDSEYKEQYKKEISLLKQGMSLRNASAITIFVSIKPTDFRRVSMSTSIRVRFL